jgi:hypothetical protein
MLASGLEFEVLKSVVGSVSVDVVHAFIGSKLAPDVLFHDESVLKFCPARRDVDEHVSV